MINFHTLRFKNFLSFGETFTEIQLDRSPTTLITGDNGAGKSTFLDALTFVLYNKPFRKINKPQLVNSVNRKGLVAEIEFSVGGKCYLIRRGIKPTKFEIYEHTTFDDIEDHLMPQDAKNGDYQTTLEKDVLKMNYQAFTQIVLLGKATFVPFMRLTTGNRRQVIEDLLGLSIFGTMNIVLKSKVKALASNLDACESNLMMCEDKIDNRQRYIDQMARERATRIEDTSSRIEELMDSVDSITIDVDKLTMKRDDMVDEVIDESKHKTKRRKLDGVSVQITTKKNMHRDVMDFFNDNDICPTCTQDIDDDLSSRKVQERQDNINKLETGEIKLEKDLTEIKAILTTIDRINGNIRKIDMRIGQMNSKLKEQNSQITKLNVDREKLNIISTDDDQKVVDELKEDLDELRSKRNGLQETSSYYASIGAMLKDDGIKTLIINKYLPIFNQLINQYLQKMGFLIKFTLDEQFNEVILSRYVDGFSYNNFSEGQKLRIDLAILLTWREVAKLKNSLNTNLLIMDEVFDSSLDQDGVDSFMEILPSLGDSNIFVVSHTPDKLYDKFRSHIGFTLAKNFSSIDCS